MLARIKDFFLTSRYADDQKKSTLPPALDPFIPSVLSFPLLTERKKPLFSLVQAEQKVLQGQMIANTLEHNAPLHAPISGIIRNTTEKIILQPTEPLEINSSIDSFSQKRKPSITLLQKCLEQSGLVGMGGAGFSTMEKIKLSYENKVHTLIINICECEPIISCDQGLCEQYSVEIVCGITLLMQCINVQQAHMVIEANKPIAIKKLKQAIRGNNNIQLSIIPSYYPSGHENQLVKYFSGEKVRINTLPVDYGYAVFNVATCYALYRAYYFQEPLSKRLVTLSNGKEHINQWVLIGTPIRELLVANHIDYSPQSHHLIMGGPMNGTLMVDNDPSVAKNTNCLLVMQKDKFITTDTIPAHQPCIRCGECVDVCPEDLLPQQLYWFAQAKNSQKAQEYRLFDCIECGNCAYVCPSKIPLVWYYRLQKKQIKENTLEQQQIQHAKERFEKRNQRLEKAKQRHQKMLQEKRREAQQKLAKKQAELKQTQQPEQKHPPSQAIAIARAKALARKKKMHGNPHSSS